VTWAAILGGAAACYALKVAGLAIPQGVLDDVRARRVAAILPIVLLAGLAATQTFTTGRSLELDARAAGVAVAVVALALRAPFLLVIALAALTAATVRLVT
jgi:hypothetical protein